jgi:hypothetical protein
VGEVYKGKQNRFCLWKYLQLDSVRIKVSPINPEGYNYSFRFDSIVASPRFIMFTGIVEIIGG